VHDAQALRRRWRVSAQASDRRLDDRLRFERIGGHNSGPIVEFARPALLRIWRIDDAGKFRVIGIDAGDRAEMGEELTRDVHTMRTVGVGLERTGGRPALDPLHDEKRLPQERGIGNQRDRLWRRDDAMERTIGREFERAIGVDQAVVGIAAQDQSALDRASGGVIGDFDRIGLARRAAVDAEMIDDPQSP
jgi:hypothetical protein